MKWHRMRQGLFQVIFSFFLCYDLNKRTAKAGGAILDVDDLACGVRAAELQFNLAVNVALLVKDALKFFD